MNTTRTAPAVAPRNTSRRAWIAPEVKDLPRLTELTLQTVGGEPGIGCGEGSTVCP